MSRRLFSTVGLATLLQIIVAWPTLTLNAATPQIVGGFTQINMQDGGYLCGIVQHRSGRLIGRTDGGGIYRSDNQGSSWTYLCSNMITPGALALQGIAVPQTINSSSNLILQAVGYSTASADPGIGVWKSTDGGATWAHTLTGVNFAADGGERQGGECIIFHPTNDSEAWVGSRGNGLWVSENAGSTWTQVTSAPNTTYASLYISPWHTNQLFAGGDNGLWVTTNHGTNWTQLNSYSLVYRVTSGPDGTIYFGGQNGSLQLIQKITSTDWSNTASYVPTDLHSAYTSVNGDDGLPIITVTVLQNGDLVASDDYAYTEISANQGASFSAIVGTNGQFNYVAGSVVPQWATFPLFRWHPTGLVQDVNNTNMWYGGGGYGPIRTPNSGSNWEYIPNGIGEVVTFRVCVHATDSNRLYIPCMDLGGAVVTDGGISGNTVSMLHQFFTSDNTQCGRCALACRTNGYNRVIFAGASQSSQKARLYATTNDGTTWYSPACAGLPTNTSFAVIEEAMDSLDNPDDFLVLIGGNTGTNLGGVYRTTNAGASFKQCNWYPSNSVSLGAYQYTWVYVDRDATNVNVRYLFACAAYPSTNYAINTGGGFFISYDRGQNWTQITGAPIPGDGSDWSGSMAADHGLSGSVWLALKTGGATGHGLAHSYNGGSNFYAAGSFTNALYVDAFKGNVVVCGEMAGDTWDKIYYSTNNGTNWGLVTATNYAFGNMQGVSLDPYRPGRIFLATGERSIGIFTPGTPEQQWQLEYFGSTNSSQSANGADPSSNGVPNLVAYALGADPLAGLSSDPLGAGSANATNYLPCAAISTNPLLAGQPVLHLNLPDSPPSDIKLQVLSSPDLVNWSTNAMRIGANAWQWVGSGPSLVAPGPDANGRALFDIGTPDWTNAGGEFQCLQVSTN